jgi:hypothetical protein
MVPGWSGGGYRGFPDLDEQPGYVSPLAALWCLTRSTCRRSLLCGALGYLYRAVSSELAARGILARGGRPLAPKVIASIVTSRSVGDG